jgi:hypothetical protein
MFFPPGYGSGTPGIKVYDLLSDKVGQGNSSQILHRKDGKRNICPLCSRPWTASPARLGVWWGEVQEGSSSISRFLWLVWGKKGYSFYDLS